MDTPDARRATEALQEIEAARRAVDTADRRSRPAVLIATAALTVLDFAAKDHLPRRGQRVVTAVALAGVLGVSLADVRSTPVVVYAAADGPAPGRAAALFGASIGWFAAERVAVALLRRSRLRRPNTAAGILLGVSRPLGSVLVTRILPRAGRDA
ncbi:hypothetical protein [Pseudonocardia sp. McavD-2-B]|uniref:hypothetical protein n=1 Tax=Pseudonocardia sp. McavD-2-B TaxID=2954499 RepID=UPI0020972EAE|nr:hypothetical protein [Pseudonocardia sp. McavD-2-B]MCO7192839.1 hypothetical protein [Pseudonocardia sp. McavD-2-B]